MFTVEAYVFFVTWKQKGKIFLWWWEGSPASGVESAHQHRAREDHAEAQPTFPDECVDPVSGLMEGLGQEAVWLNGHPPTKRRNPPGSAFLL